MNNVTKIFYVLLSFLSISILFASNVNDKNNIKPIFIFDLDQTITNPRLPPSGKIITFVYQALKQASLKNFIFILWDLKKIINQGKAFSKLEGATTESTIHKTFAWLKEEGYGNFTSLYDDILLICANPQPIMPMIHFVQTLKDRGFKIIAATGQDALHHSFYRKYLRGWYGIDLDTLFYFTFTSFSLKISQLPTTKKLASGIYRVGPTTYMTSKGVNKPYVNYFSELYTLLKNNLYPQYLVFIDDNKKNINGFNTFLKNNDLAGKSFQFTSHKKSDAAQKNEIQHIKEQLNLSESNHSVNVQISAAKTRTS